MVGLLMRTNQPLPSTLYRAQEIQEIDRAVIDAGTPGYTLMCRAGQAALDCIKRHWPSTQQITLFCGTGNNGGDGYVLARLAKARGISVTIFQLGNMDSLQGEALQAYEEMESRGIVPTPFSSGVTLPQGLLVDAMLGIGVDRELQGAWRDAVERINRSGQPVLSIDTPSGLDADRGVPMGVAVRADITLTMIALKRGLFTAQGADHAGQVELAWLGINATDFLPPSGELLQISSLSAKLGQRARCTHKGEMGHALIIGGNRGMGGAARIAAEAAARTGAGLVSVATHPDHAALLNLDRPELMVHPVNNREQLRPLLERASVLILGPGLGVGHWSRELLESALEQRLPMVVDADALNLIAQTPRKRENWVLTPHPGEAARLLQGSTGSIQQNRFEAIFQLQGQFGGVSVLKGNGTLVASDSSHYQLCPLGNPGMASGGMGDLLSGVIGGLIAQGYSLGEAARIGVCIHAKAGDLAAMDGERGLLASDLLPWIRRLLNPES